MDGRTFGFMELRINVDKESGGHGFGGRGIRIAIRTSSILYAYLNVYSPFANFVRFIIKEALICNLKYQ